MFVFVFIPLVKSIQDITRVLLSWNYFCLWTSNVNVAVGFECG